MKRLFAALAIAVTACSPPTATNSAEQSSDEADVAAAVDYGPYSNSWASGEEASFRHTLHARTPGQHPVTIQARTDSPGGETVAVYPIGDDGLPGSVRIVFVIASTVGTSEMTMVDFPASGAGVPVAVVVEHDRRYGGNYTLTVGE